MHFSLLSVNLASLILLSTTFKHLSCCSSVFPYTRASSIRQTIPYIGFQYFTHFSLKILWQWSYAKWQSVQRCYKCCKFWWPRYKLDLPETWVCIELWKVLGSTNLSQLLKVRVDVHTALLHSTLLNQHIFSQLHLALEPLPLENTTLLALQSWRSLLEPPFFVILLWLLVIMVVPLT